MSESVTADENGWLPIETKPKDQDYMSGLPGDATSGLGYALNEDEQIAFLVWWAYRGQGISETTHWRPLPAGPVSPASLQPVEA